MKLVSFERDGRPGVGALHDGEVIDLSLVSQDLPTTMTGLIEQFHGRWGELAARVSASGVSRLPMSSLKLLPPIPAPGKIICIGLNYVDHAAESPYKDLPTHPVLFSRFVQSLVASGESIVRPRNSEQLDWEGEIALVMGAHLRHAAPDTALAAVAGYALFNDASIRDYQFKSNQWLMGKTFDATGGFGPFLATAEELPAAIKGLTLETRLNGELMQQANTSDMIFGVSELLCYITEGITLAPGDIVVTGTPAGVGFARKPPVYMVPGDVVTVTAPGLGELVNPIEAEA